MAKTINEQPLRLLFGLVVLFVLCEQTCLGVSHDDDLSKSSALGEGRIVHDNNTFDERLAVELAKLCAASLLVFCVTGRARDAKTLTSRMWRLPKYWQINY
eukprot:m.36575 g.36575  ORF g.36575 m.36575 type:complete len:101 (+) comp9146_c0_seq1:43-345(+)